MSTGKKKSGFQITSVTSDYDQTGSEARKESFGSDPGSSGLSPLANGGHQYPGRSPRNSPRNSPPASANAHPAGGEAVLPPDAHTTKEAEARVAEEVRTAMQRNPGVVGLSPPGTADGKVLTVPLESSPSLGVTHANSGEILSSQLASGSFSVPGNFEASNGSQTSSRGPQLPASTANGHGPLVNGTASPKESKAASANGAIPKNGPLSSMVNGSLASPIAITGPVMASSSRFRVVKLDQGSGEPYKRGRWTCMDFYDRDMDNQSISKILDSMRHGHSLDSHLEVAGLSLKPVTQFYPQPQGKGHGASYVHSQGTAHLVLHNATLNVTSQHQARSLSGLPQINLELGAVAALQSPLSARNSPTSDLRPLFPLPHTSDRAQGTGTTTSATDTRSASSGPKASSAPASEANVQGDSGSREHHASSLPSGTSSQTPQIFHPVPVVVVEGPGTNHLKPKSVRQLIQTEEKNKGPAQDSRSRSPSPTRTSYQNGSPSRLLSDSFGVHSPRLTLDRSIFTLDNEDESGFGSSMIAIDNKIEQAMDLVKTHLMFAVREEVEVLREQIKDLMDRNAHLEQENNVLKALASPEQLSEMQSKMHNLRQGMGPQAKATSA